MDIRQVPARAARLFGELASTYVAGGWCFVGRLRDLGELKQREPYRDVVVYGRGRTFVEAFERAERHYHAGTPDWILDMEERSARGLPTIIGER